MAGRAVRRWGTECHAFVLSHGQRLGITFAADKGFQAGRKQQVLPKGARPGGLACWDRKHGRRQARKVSGLFGQGIGRAFFSPFGNDAASISDKDVMLRALAVRSQTEESTPRRDAHVAESMLKTYIGAFDISICYILLIIIGCCQNNGKFSSAPWAFVLNCCAGMCGPGACYSRILEWVHCWKGYLSCPHFDQEARENVSMMDHDWH